MKEQVLSTQGRRKLSFLQTRGRRLVSQNRGVPGKIQEGEAAASSVHALHFRRNAGNAGEGTDALTTFFSSAI